MNGFASFDFTLMFNQLKRFTIDSFSVHFSSPKLASPVFDAKLASPVF